MKRKIAILLLIFVFCFLFIKSNYPYQNEIDLGDTSAGDVNSDGKINSLDYIIIRKYLMNTMTLENKEKSLADVNSDGKISSLDYILIRKSILEGTKIEGKTNSSTNASSSSSESTSTHTATPTPIPTPTPTPKSTENSKPTSTENTSVSISLNTTSATLTYSIAHTFTITSSGNGTIKCSSSDTSVAVCEISGTTLIVIPKAKNVDNQKATITVSKGEKNVKLSIVVNRKELKCPGTATKTVTYNGKEQSYGGNSCPAGSTGGTAKGTKVGTYTANCNANSGYKFSSTCTNAKLVISSPTYSCKLSYDKMSNELKITGTATGGIVVKSATINGVTTATHHPTYDGGYTGKVYFSDGKTCEDRVNVTRLKILFIGDSITAGINNTGSPWYSWADYIGDKYNFNVRKAGYPSYLISDYKPGLWIMWQVWQNLNWPYDSNQGNYVKGQITGGYNNNGTAKIQYDYVILHGGINDIANYVPKGAYNESDKSASSNFDTFYGGLDRYVFLAKQYWPNAKIGYIVNYQTPEHPNNRTDSTFNSKTQDYFNDLKYILSHKWKIPYLDLYNGKDGSGKYYSGDILKVTGNVDLFDGLHPKKSAYKEKLGPIIYKWIKTL